MTISYSAKDFEAACKAQGIIIILYFEQVWA